MTTSRHHGGGAHTACPRCGTPTLTQAPTRGMPLDVVADAVPVPLARARSMSGPDQLVWCVIPGQLATTPPRLRWVSPTHPDDCARDHVLDHACRRAPPAPAHTALPRQPGLFT